jgi:adenosylcobyric acid synthase
MLTAEQMIHPTLCIAAGQQHFAGKGLMVQGTSSDAGKSLLVTALCRVLHNAGLKVAPFKPQNMALNSAVTADGGEIGRATATQAAAARCAPSVHMNPILLKPCSETGAQVIVQGKLLPQHHVMAARDYQTYKQQAHQAVMDSYQQLCASFDSIVIEGAGSPAEVNLRQHDIANMGFAEAADVPVVLVADIDRGGVFAQLLGTLMLLSPSEQSRVVGFVINKFRGDIQLLTEGVRWLEQVAQRPVFGVLPYMHDLRLAEEDAINQQQTQGQVRLKVVVPVYPQLSNHTDADPLRHHPQIDLQFIYAPDPLPAADVILLLGSKNTCADLAFFKQYWQQDLLRHLRYGGKLFGICGGLQMLGEWIHDPLGMEGAPARHSALGLMPLTTTLHGEKTLQQVQGVFSLGADAVPVRGYEIHLGQTTAHGSLLPLLAQSDSRCAGFRSEDNQIAGCYWHGLFDEPQALAALAAWAGQPLSESLDMTSAQEQSFQQLANSASEHLDIASFMRFFS